MEINRNNIFDLMGITGVKPSKDFGQNFLVEPAICRHISDILVTSDNDLILEVGPGLGSLTNFLNEKEGTLECVDIDPKMISVLTEVYKNSNITFINNDIRKVELDKYTRIIGNLPYNITTELVVHLLLNAPNCKQFVFMIQAEALNRFVDISGKDYGPASVLIHLLGKIKKEFIVKAGSFYPAPKCNSVVFQIYREEKHDFELAKSVYMMTKRLFLNRRKTLMNNLSNAFGREKAIEVIETLGLKETIRPEEISPEKFIEIYNVIK